MVARGGAVCEANRDAEGARRASTEGASQSNHRHADFQNAKHLISLSFINRLPGRLLLDLHPCA